MFSDLVPVTRRSFYLQNYKNAYAYVLQCLLAGNLFALCPRRRCVFLRCVAVIYSTFHACVHITNDYHYNASLECSITVVEHVVVVVLFFCSSRVCTTIGVGSRCVKSLRYVTGNNDITSELLVIQKSVPDLRSL